MEIGRGLFVGFFVGFVAVCLCGPARDGFLNVKCDQNITCPTDVSLICCTDGNTYPNQCALDQENQRRVCFEGKFNPIAKVHDGPCNATTRRP